MAGRLTAQGLASASGCAPGHTLPCSWGSEPGAHPSLRPRRSCASTWAQQGQPFSSKWTQAGRSCCASLCSPHATTPAPIPDSSSAQQARM